MPTRYEIYPYLQDEEEDGLGDLGAKLLTRTKQFITIFTIHGSGQHTVYHHEEYDQELKDPEVGFPELSTGGIVL